MSKDRIETNCDLCGSSHKTLVTTENDYPISRCLDCGLIYVSALPQLENGKIEGEYYTDDRAEIEVVKKRYELVSKFLINEIGRHAAVGKLLDVGCGYGFFLLEARRHGWDVFGSDLSETAVAYARKEHKLEGVVCADLSDEAFLDQKFNAVNLTNVLEHVPSPTAVLKDCKRLMDENGILTIRVPNMSFNDLKLSLLPLLKFLRLAKGGDQNYLSSPPPLHLIGFSSATLQRYLEQVGFATIEIKPSKLSAVAQQKFVFRLIEFFVQLLYKISFRKINLSPTILAVARKG